MTRRTSGLLALGWAAIGLVWYSLLQADPGRPLLVAFMWVFSCGIAGWYVAGFIDGE